MNRSEEASLAWALVDSTRGVLHTHARARLCAKIGAGELASAINDVLVCYASKDIELRSDLATPLQAWVRGYCGTDNEPVLRRLLDCIRLSTDENSKTGPTGNVFSVRASASRERRD